MKKHYLILAIILFTTSISFAQIEMAGPTTSCVGNVEVYTAGYECGNKYKWSCGGCTFETPANGYKSVEVVWTSGGTKTITVNYSSSGCPGSGKPANLDTQTLSVNVLGNPSTPSSITGAQCISISAQTLSYSVSTVANATSYLWTISGAGWSLNSTTGQTISVNAPEGSTSATLCARAYNSNCGTYSSYKCITITRNSVTDIFYNQSCQNRLTRFSLPASDVTPGASYTWSIPTGNEWSIAAGGVDFGQGYAQIDINVGTTAGNVCVTKTLAGCSSSTYCEYVVPATIGSGGCGRLRTEQSIEEKVLDLVAYPNPTNGNLTLHLPDGEFKVDILNALGTTSETLGLLKGKAEINISHLSDGLYILVAQDERKKLIKRISIVK